MGKTHTLGQQPPIEQSPEQQFIFDQTDKITLEDYINDDEFQPVIQYLLNGQLTDEDATDRKALFTADSYIHEKNKLFRITENRAKKQRAIAPVSLRVCISRSYQLQLIQDAHIILRHASHFNLLKTLRPRFYFNNLCRLYLEIPRTCDICNRVKRNQSPRQPLHPGEII